MLSCLQDELGQIVVALPDYVCLAKEPSTKAGLENMKLLLLLLLGCAVQCPNKERFITNIKELPLDIQHDIVECIKQVSFYYYAFFRFIVEIKHFLQF